MTRDLLQIAKDLEYTYGCTCDDCRTNREYAAAIRSAHTELTTAREAYLNLGSERDLLLMERDQLRAELELFRSAFIEMSDSVPLNIGRTAMRTKAGSIFDRTRAALRAAMKEEQ